MEQTTFKRDETKTLFCVADTVALRRANKIMLQDISYGGEYDGPDTFWGYLADWTDCKTDFSSDQTDVIAKIFKL